MGAAGPTRTESSGFEGGVFKQPGGGGWEAGGWAAPWECRATQSRQAARREKGQGLALRSGHFERAGALEAEPRRSLLHPLQLLGPERVHDTRGAEAVPLVAVAEQQPLAALALRVLARAPEATRLCLPRLRLPHLPHGCRVGRAGRAGGRALPRRRAPARRRRLQRALLEAALGVEGHEPRRAAQPDGAAARVPGMAHGGAHQRSADAAPPPRGVHHDIRQPRHVHAAAHAAAGVRVAHGRLVEGQRGAGHEAAAGVLGAAAVLRDEHELRRHARAREGELR